MGTYTRPNEFWAVMLDLWEKVHYQFLILFFCSCFLTLESSIVLDEMFEKFFFLAMNQKFENHNFPSRWQHRKDAFQNT